ncbi:MAG: energy transducer TonB [Blastocatellia bacterium]
MSQAQKTMLARLLLPGWLLLCAVVFAQERVSVAVADFSGDGVQAAALLRQMAARDFALVDADLVRAALRGAGYTGSLNLSREEARSSGMAIGCDYYLLGTAQVLRRTLSAEEFYYEGIAGIFTVETRSGRLLLFDFIRTRAADEQTARAQLEAQLAPSWQKISAAINQAASLHQSESIVTTLPPAPVIEVFDDEPGAKKIAQPVFYQRLRPAYTDAAESLAITATVELEVVFREDGRVGEAEVTRWAGFGLDESALATVRQLRFKPAEREGRPVSLRALVRYNFRRPPPAAQLQEEQERLRRSLRDALRRPQPNQ